MKAEPAPNPVVAVGNARFGNAASVLVGDFLYSRAFQMMVSVNRMRVLEVLSDATNVIAAWCGQNRGRGSIWFGRSREKKRPPCGRRPGVCPVRVRVPA